MPDSLNRLDFTQMAMLASAATGTVCAWLGMFVVLRRVVFVGAALAQLASAGVALALVLGWPVAVGAGLLSLLGVGLFSSQLPRRRLPEEAWIGVAFAAAGAAGVLFMNFVPHGEGEQAVLFGNILGTTPGDLLRMAGVFGTVGLAHWLLAKEFRLVAFDPEMARVLGYRVELWNFWFFLTLGAAIAVAVHAAGVLLVFSYLVFPPLVGLLLARRFRHAALVAMASAVIASVAGVWASVRWDLPTGATIVAACFLLCLGALAWRRSG